MPINMDKRRSSPTASPSALRPSTNRKRSHSFPIVEALGCSTPEAQLILAEGRAAVRSRQASALRRGRRNRSMNDNITTFRPQDHMKYLSNAGRTSSVPMDEGLASPCDARAFRHSRFPSDATDRSTSTVTGPTSAPADAHTRLQLSPATPLGNYSANLASFIRSQLSTIPTYRPTSSISPRSCPDLSFHPRSPLLSPAKPLRGSINKPQAIEIPPVQPPLRSAFSAWSSTDDETDDDDDDDNNDDDDIPPIPGFELGKGNSRASNYTPSLLRYYESSNASSFLFSSTPLDEGEPDTAMDFTFPNQSALSASSAEPHSPYQHDDYPSSALSTRPQLTSSLAPSPSSVSTASYFECKRPISIAPGIKDRIIAAVTPQHGTRKIVPAISPFEGGALANIHDLYIESQQRICVDGMSFDMLRDFTMPSEGMQRLPTPC